MGNYKARRVSRREFLKLAGVGATGVLAASALGGCAPKATPSPVPQPTEEPVTLRYQNHWGGMDAHATAMDWVYKTFQERNPNIKLNIVFVPSGGESFNKIRADCAAGDCPDIIHEVYLDDYDADYIMDLAPYLDADPTWKASFIPESLEELSWDGHLFGVSLEYCPQDCIWNTRLLDQVGKAVPKTWADLLALGDALKSKGVPLTSFQGMMGLHGFTALVFGRPGAAEAMAKEQWDCEQVLYAFTRLKELKDNGFLPANDAEIDWKQAGALWTTGRLGAYMNGAWGIKNELTAEGVDPEVRNHVAFSPFPSTPGGLGRTIQWLNGTGMGLASHLLKQPKRFEAALKFLKFWTGAESAMQFATEAQSPTAVKIDFPKDKVPLLAAFMDAVKQADVAFTLPRSRKLRARAWDHSVAGYTALLLGKSAEEATQTYAAELRK